MTSKVNSTTFTLYTKDGCIYCEKAKAYITYDLFDSFEEIKLDKIKDSKEYDNLLQTTGHRTFPFVFYNGEFIGGYNELKANTRFQ